MRPIVTNVAPAPIVSAAQAWQEIDRKLIEAETSQRYALKRMKEAGALLSRLKDMVPHGQWLAQLQENCRYGPRMAQKLMRLHAKWDVFVAKGVECLSLDQALDAIKSALEGAFEETAAQALTTNDTNGGSDEVPHATSPRPEQSSANVTIRVSPQRVPAEAEKINAHVTLRDAPPPQHGDEPTDDQGVAIPAKALPAWETAKRIVEICRGLDETKQSVEATARSFGGRMMHAPSILQQLATVRHVLWGWRATHVCPYCKGEKDDCKACKGEGWTDTYTWKQSPKGKAAQPQK
jgi:hypothetical protein